jgi:predicted DNA-binding antitoxin AbrB/MazE fold protein
MRVATYEAIVENGQIKLVEPASLPEHAKVYVVVTGVEDFPRVRMMSPRLARPEQAVDFAKEVSEESPDAGL